MTAITTTPLSRLTLSKLNPRTRKPGEARVKAMAESIRSVGLLTSLIGHETADETIAIVGGGIRLRALWLLAETHPQDFPPDAPVPVALIEERDAAIAGAAEQAARAALDPLDEFDAYSRTLDIGGTVESIARAFAVTPRYVEQRLALAALPPGARDALAAGEIPLYVAQALASAGKQAGKLWDAHADDARRNPVYAARAIRADLKFLDARHSDIQRLERIGREAFEAEGGRVEEDLFGENIRLVNPDALDRASEKRVAAAAERIAAEAGFTRWKTERPHLIEGAERIHPVAVPLSDAEQARREELEEMNEREEFAPHSDEDRELEALEEKSETREWTPGQAALGTACVIETWSGAIDLVGAVIEADRIEEAIAADVLTAPKPAPDDGETRDATATEPGWPAALIAELRRIPADIARDQLLDKPDLAISILARDFATRLHHRICDVDCRKTTRSGFIEDDVAITAWEAEIAQDAEPLAAFLERGAKHRNRILAGVAAATLHPNRAPDLAGLLDLDIRAHWTPDATFFARLTKPQLIAIAAELGAEEWVTQTMKKGELTEALAALFVAPPKAIAEPIDAWLPQPLRPDGETAV